MLPLLIGPFGAPDEREHFLRAAAVANGYVVPEVGFDPAAARFGPRMAGGRVGREVVNVANEVDYRDAPRSGLDPNFRVTLGKLRSALHRRAGDDAVFVEHSNTALYPPMLYAAPVAAVVIGKLAGVPILVWLYLGRVLNGLISCALIWWAMRLNRENAAVILLLAALPITLFQEASVSADALLLAMFIFFAALLSRFSTGQPMRRDEVAGLGLSTFLISVGKVAYLPLAILPPLCAADRATWRSKTVRASAWVSLACILGWAGWAYIVHDKVFSIRPGLVIDPGAQVRFMLSHPVDAAGIFARSILSQAYLLFDAVGRKIGADTIVLNKGYCIFLLAAAIAISLVRTTDTRPNVRVFAAAVLLSLFCALAIFLLLYLQFNEVAAIEVIGAQGRYFTPLLFLCLILMPKPLRADRLPSSWRFAPPLAAASSSVVTLLAVVERYWS